jgi:hypothetical protein
MSEWLTFPAQDGYYWMGDRDKPYKNAVEIVHVWTYSDGRVVETIGNDWDIPFEELSLDDIRWKPIPTPTDLPWPEENDA